MVTGVQSPISVVIADDSFIVREGVRMLLVESGYDVVAVADDYDSLMATVDEHRPDVVITDIRMPPTNTDEGVRAARQIRAAHPDVGVVVLSQYAEPDYALRLFEEGSAGFAYLLKERVGDLHEMEAAITAVCQGGSTVDPKVVDALVEADGNNARRSSTVSPHVNLRCSPTSQAARATRRSPTRCSSRSGRSRRTSTPSSPSSTCCPNANRTAAYSPCWCTWPRQSDEKASPAPVWPATPDQQCRPLVSAREHER
jgi:DNA-binding NarL/FixJ family response regulator